MAERPSSVSATLASAIAVSAGLAKAAYAAGSFARPSGAGGGGAAAGGSTAKSWVAASSGAAAMATDSPTSPSSDFLACIQHVLRLNFEAMTEDSVMPLAAVSRLADPFDTGLDVHREDHVNLLTDFGSAFTAHLMAGFSLLTTKSGVVTVSDSLQLWEQILQFFMRPEAARSALRPDINAYLAWADEFILQIFGRFFEYREPFEPVNLPHSLGSLHFRPEILRVLPFDAVALESNKNLQALMMLLMWRVATMLLGICATSDLGELAKDPTQRVFFRLLQKMSELISCKVSAWGERERGLYTAPFRQLSTLSGVEAVPLYEDMNRQLNRLLSFMSQRTSCIQTLLQGAVAKEKESCRARGDDESADAMMPARLLTLHCDPGEESKERYAQAKYFISDLACLLKPVGAEGAAKVELWGHFCQVLSANKRLSQISALLLSRQVFLELMEKLQEFLPEKSAQHLQLALLDYAEKRGILPMDSEEVLGMFSRDKLVEQYQCDQTNVGRLFAPRVTALMEVQRDLLIPWASMACELKVKTGDSFGSAAEFDARSGATSSTALDVEIRDELVRMLTQYGLGTAEQRVAIKTAISEERSSDATVAEEGKPSYGAGLQLARNLFNLREISQAQSRVDIFSGPSLDIPAAINRYFSDINAMQALENALVGHERRLAGKFSGSTVAASGAGRGSFAPAAAVSGAGGGSAAPAAASGAGAALTIIGASVIPEDKRQYYAFMRKLHAGIEDYLRRLGKKEHTRGKARLEFLLKDIAVAIKECADKGDYSQCLGTTLPLILNFIATGEVAEVDSGRNFFGVGASGFKEDSLRMCLAKEFVPDFNGEPSVRVFATRLKGGTDAEKRVQWDAVLNLFALPPEAVTAAEISTLRPRGR